jgi:hypothetical protein
MDLPREGGMVSVAEEVRASLFPAECLEVCPVCQLPTVTVIHGKQHCRNCGYIES